MTLSPKSAEAIERMRAAGRVVVEILGRLRQMTCPGVRTADLETEAVRMMAEQGARSLFLGQPHPRGGRLYPGQICVSINEELVHGIPGDRRIAEGDIVSVDVGVEKDGWCGDAARTFVVGRVPARVRELVETTAEALEVVRREARAGVLWSAVAGRIEVLVQRAGFAVVTDYCGHGIGRCMWESPSVPNYVAREDFLLLEGLTLAVEPMVNMGGPEVREKEDGWTVVTGDGKPCAHFEDTFVIRRDGAEPLTRLPQAQVG